MHIAHEQFFLKLSGIQNQLPIKFGIAFERSKILKIINLIPQKQILNFLYLCIFYLGPFF